MTIKEKLSNARERINKYKKTSLLGAASLALIGTTVLKENVHLGSVTVYNPEESQYVWGLNPQLEIEGDSARGNMVSLGLFCSDIDFATGIEHNGDTLSLGGIFVGDTCYRFNTIHNGDTTSAGIIAGKADYLEGSTKTGDINCYGHFSKTPISTKTGVNKIKGIEGMVFLNIPSK